MYLNIIINDRINIKVAPVSIAEMRAIQKNIRSANDSVQDVIDEGNTQVARVDTAGSVQVIRLMSEGNQQIDRVVAEGDIQVGRASAEADRAEVAADEIKDVGVADPVTSVPLLPGNVPGVPTVSYDPVTGLFTYGIPVGKTGETAAVVTPQGAASVAELNALVSDPGIGFAWWMTDSGTITYGDPDTAVVTNDIVVWVAEGYFFNAGQMEAGAAWPGITDVTVEGLAPAIGDDLARHGTSYTKAEQDSTDGIQDTAIALNTAKVTYDDASVVAQNTIDAAAADTKAQGAVDTNITQQTAIDLNTAKTSYTDAAIVAQNTIDAASAQSTADGAVTANGIQDTAIALNTAKVSYTDATIVAQNTIDAAAADTKAQGAVDINVSQQTAIDLNSAKVGVTDQIHSTIGETGVDAILNMVSCTQAEYDALTPVATTVYVIVG